MITDSSSRTSSLENQRGRGRGRIGVLSPTRVHIVAYDAALARSLSFDQPRSDIETVFVADFFCLLSRQKIEEEPVA